MSTSNESYGVGGTAKDGGLSTADTVRDGGSDGGNRGEDKTYEPPQDVKDEVAGNRHAHAGNPISGVGGTAQDGGLSTADTVKDGGPDSKKKDGDYKE